MLVNGRAEQRSSYLLVYHHTCSDYPFAASANSKVRKEHSDWNGIQKIGSVYPLFTSENTSHSLFCVIQLILPWLWASIGVMCPRPEEANEPQIWVHIGQCYGALNSFLSAEVWGGGDEALILIWYAVLTNGNQNLLWCTGDRTLNLIP